MIRRPPAFAANGMIVSSHPLATEAGVAMLRAGGHAVDGAIAAAAVLSVVEPSASGLGGDAFFLVHEEAARKVLALNGSGVAPETLTRDRFTGLPTIPLRDPLSCTVPGCVAAWADASSRWGRLPWRDLLQPAIALATDGFPVSWKMGRILQKMRGVIEADPGLRAIYLRGDGTPLRAGDICRPEAIARTLRSLSQDGAESFYNGKIAESLAAGVTGAGGALSAGDLSAHKSQFAEPYRMTLDDLTIHEQPLPSQGLLLLLMHGIVAAPPDPHRERRSWDEIHQQIESKKIAFAFKEAFLTDPEFLPVPEGILVDTLIRPELLRSLAELTREEPLVPGLGQQVVLEVAGRADPGIRTMLDQYTAAGYEPLKGTGGGEAGIDTTYLCAADRDGNLVGLVQSIFHPFGSGFLEPSTGILLNNRAVGFSLDPVHINRLEPGKRTLHTLNSYLIYKNDRPWLVAGTPGGDNQVQTNLQIIRHLQAGGNCWPGPRPQVKARWNQARQPASRSFDLSAADQLATALEAPRWRVEPDGEVRIESRFPAEIRRRLRKLGHPVVQIGPWEGSGYVQAIRCYLPEETESAKSVYIGATDPRGEGVALGL